MSMGFLIALMVFSIPIVAILADAYVKSRKIDLKNEAFKEQEDQMKLLNEQLGKLSAENEQLRERMLNIETIITEPDWEFLLAAHREDTQVTERAQQLAKVVAKGKEDTKKTDSGGR